MIEHKMELSRRQFLHRSLWASTLAVTPLPLFANNRPALTIPPLMDVGRGRPIRLEFRPAQTQFEAGKLVEVWGVNGHYLAPTVRVKSGDFVKLTYTNSLPQPLSVNIQGLLATTAMIGSRPLPSHQSWSPIFPVQQPACTCWYHANTPFNTAYQVYRGLAGLWLIEDSHSRQANLPNKYGVDDIPLILQDQLINKNGEQILDQQTPQFWGKRLFVNGQASPYLNVPRGWVRLRIVNASLSRPYALRLDNDQPLYLIATGQGFLAEPVEMDSVWLAPAERVELLIDLRKGETLSLISGQKRGIFAKIEQLFTHDNTLIDNVVLELRPQGLPSALAQMPTLPPFSLDDFKLKIGAERRFQIRPLDPVINQQRFDPQRIDFSVKKGTVERWYLTSNEAIGFHIQGAKFLIETRNRQKMPYKQLAWQDTVWLEKEQETTLLVRFEHTASEAQPFTFGITDLRLRDKGGMGQFVVK